MFVSYGWLHERRILISLLSLTISSRNNLCYSVLLHYWAAHTESVVPKCSFHKTKRHIFGCYIVPVYFGHSFGAQKWNIPFRRLICRANCKLAWSRYRYDVDGIWQKLLRDAWNNRKIPSNEFGGWSIYQPLEFYIGHCRVWCDR